MQNILQPILTPVKGSADITISRSLDFPDEILVFVGLALLEKVPDALDEPSCKMLLARLYNAKMSGRKLVEKFGVARSTLQRWGAALKNGDMDEIARVFSGQGAPRKVTPQIERYALDRYHELFGREKRYNQIIRQDIERYFKVSLSSERLRQIFAAERAGAASQEEHSASPSDDYTAENSGEVLVEAAANDCEARQKCPANKEPEDASRNYSLPPPQATLPISGHEVSEIPQLHHHAGLLLASRWMDEVTKDWGEREELVCQWLGQVLLGAVNHEQSKRLNFSSLEVFTGPTIRSQSYQRILLGEIAHSEATSSLLERNGRLLNLAEKELFYFDPHTSDYTGELDVLKGWCGGKHRVEKIINMDFIHDEFGNPCFVQHADNYYEMRTRFFMCSTAFRRILPHAQRTLTWVVDRGIYGLETLRKIRDELGDHIITWDKNYKKDGWDDDAATDRFDLLRPRNNAADLRCYQFQWQEAPWPRDPRFRRLIVRAINPSGREIEVAILCSDPERAAAAVIRAIFNRWLQENDFAYMDRHVGINELTSRAHDPYCVIQHELEDRQIESRACKALKKEKATIESGLKQLLLKREKHQQKEAAQSRAEREQLSALDQRIRHLNMSDETAMQKKELKATQQARARKKTQHEKNKVKRKESSQALQQQIDQKNEKLEEIQEQGAVICREESRLNALIDEQYVRLDTRRKAFMDSIRISSRNIFYQLIREFRPLYNNYRDDHFILRELTRSAGLIELREGTIHVSLIPAMQYQPAIKEIVQQFLAQISEQINRYRGAGFVPLNIQLLCSESDAARIDCVIKTE